MACSPFLAEGKTMTAQGETSRPGRELLLRIKGWMKALEVGQCWEM